MPSKELFIGGLDRHCTQTDLENTFEKHGKITRCSVKNSASGAVFAFIEFEDENSAEDALNAENGREMNGAAMSVEFAKGRRDNGGGGRDRDGGGGYGGRGGGDRFGGRDRDGGRGGGFRGGRGGGGGGDRNCYKCGEPGHISRDCRQGGGGGGGGGFRGGRGGGGGGDRNCYKCGEPGHISRDCRQGGGGGGGGFRNGGGRDRNGGGDRRRSRSRS